MNAVGKQILYLSDFMAIRDIKCIFCNMCRKFERETKLNMQGKNANKGSIGLIILYV